MNNRTFLILSSLVGLFFAFSTNAKEGTPMKKETLRDSNVFVVKEDWIACYKDKNGTPSDDIVEVFYSGDSIYPQHWQHRDPYSEYENRLYLWVKYNNTPSVGCFVEATTASISAVINTSIENSTAIDTSSTGNSTSIDSVSADNIENTPSTNNAADENAPSNNGTPVENVPLVNSASTENPPPVESNTDESLKIYCVAPGTTATRRLETIYKNYPSKLPCKVVYFREDGKTQIIADAKRTEGFCEEKRDEFLEKLKGWGWQCK